MPQAHRCGIHYENGKRTENLGGFIEKWGLEPRDHNTQMHEAAEPEDVSLDESHDFDALLKVLDNVHKKPDFNNAIILLCGKSGVGKTTIADELAKEGYPALVGPIFFGRKSKIELTSKEGIWADRLFTKS